MSDRTTQLGAEFRPVIASLGIDGLLVRFSDELSDRGNRAALAFRAAVDAMELDGIEEVASSLRSVQIRFDPRRLSLETLTEVMRTQIDSRNWREELLPVNRRLWRVPTAYGGSLGPQLERAADLAGVSAEAAITQLSNARVRVMSIGFAPGQPYLGQLPDTWNLPRQTDLQTRVPRGTLALAVRQFVLFSAPSQTGWYHVGKTAFQCFRPDGEPAFPLQPGDEMEFSRRLGI